MDLVQPFRFTHKKTKTQRNSLLRLMSVIEKVAECGTENAAFHNLQHSLNLYL